MTVKEFLHKIVEGCKNVSEESAKAEISTPDVVTPGVSTPEVSTPMKDATVVQEAISKDFSVASAKKKSIRGIFDNTVVSMYNRLEGNPFVTDSVFGYAILVAAVILFSIVGVIAAFGNGYAEIQWSMIHPDVPYTSTMAGFVSVIAVSLYQVIIILGTIYVILVNAVRLLGRTILGVRDELKPI